MEILNLREINDEAYYCAVSIEDVNSEKIERLLERLNRLDTCFIVSEEVFSVLLELVDKCEDELAYKVADELKKGVVGLC